MTILVLIVWVLAVARLTRLINGDKVTDLLRTYPADRIAAANDRQDEALAVGNVATAAREMMVAGRWDKALYFVGCPWCVGMWLSFGTAWAPLWLADNRVVQYVAIALAASHLIGVCARFADTEEIVIEKSDTATG
jgi:hypothetical protein